jgi:uncharacterized damage-inducible protein DinB
MSEPWLRGIQLSVDPVVAPVFFALQQVREDLGKHTSALSAEQVWRQPSSLPSLGFHLRHIAGSLDRLTTYLEGNQLTDSQIAKLKAESEAGADVPELLAGIEQALARAESAIAAVDPKDFRLPRYVGRQKLPTTVIGLIIHIAEHTQRHCGQAITTARLVAG